MNEKLTLQDIVDLLAKKAKISKKDSESFLRELFTVINDNILESDVVKIKDFGTFKPTLISSRESVDVNTGQKIEIPAHYRLIFTPDKTLKELVNKPFAAFESILLTDNSPLISEAIAEETDEEENSPEDQEHNEDKVEKIKIEATTKKEVEPHIEEDIPVKLEKTAEPKPESYVQPSFSYSYVSDKDKENQDKIVLTMPVADITHPIALKESDLINQSEQEEIVDNSENFEEETTEYLSDQPIVETVNEIVELEQPPVYIKEEIISETSEIKEDMPPPFSAPASNEEVVTEEKPRKTKPETISIEMPKTATPPLRIRKADLVRDDEIELSKIENNFSQSTENVDPYMDDDIKTDDFDENDPDFQDDYTYEDYYLRDKKTRNVSRIVLMVLIGIVIIGIIIFVFSRLFKDSDTSRNVPVYNANSFVASDTLPILKQDSAAISQLKKEDSIRFPNQADKKIQSTQEDTSRDQSLQGKKSVTLRPGETLMKLSAQYYGRKDYWVYIYSENKDRIPDPNNVSVGTYLVIPELSKYVSNPDSQSSLDEAKRMSEQILRGQY